MPIFLVIVIVIVNYPTLVEASISDPHQMARFLAAVDPHSGDWLLALPVSSCGLRLADEAVRVAIALRLGCSVCIAHTCSAIARVVKLPVIYVGGKLPVTYR